MTKEELIALGLSGDVADKVLASHKKAIDGNYEPKARNEELREQLKTATTTIAERDKQIKDLSKFETENKDFQTRIAKIQEDNLAMAEKHKTELAERDYRSALRTKLTGKVHDVDLVISLFDKAKIKLDDKGEIIGGYDDEYKRVSTEKPYLILPDGGKKPAVKITGKGVTDNTADGRTNQNQNTNPGVALAKQLAVGKTKTQEITSKGQEAYFGTNTPKK